MAVIFVAVVVSSSFFALISIVVKRGSLFSVVIFCFCVLSRLFFSVFSICNRRFAVSRFIIGG